MNESAWYMLGLPSLGGSANKMLDAVSTELAQQFDEWQNHELSETRVFSPGGINKDLLPSFTNLGSGRQAGTLIFLEDTARMAQQAQQMKLASLGRLTASIAHEIRNPLGAISHAEQLLAEAVTDNPADRRLLEIIHTNSSRVNDIIENVLQLSRRDRSIPDDILLKDWLEKFVDEFTHNQNLRPGDIGIHIDPEDIIVYFDATQLHQILWNLCNNAVRHSQGYNRQPLIHLQGGWPSDMHRPFLDVIDHGPGIPPEQTENIFEPFYTTEAKGSGLGLYIARELAECNQARLSYIAIPTGGSCFRLEFSDKTKASLDT
jgi:two-component system sensor histidine kinase PilS (NtrC family)